MYVFLTLGTLGFCLAPILIRLAGKVPAVAIAVWRTGIAAVALIPPAVGWRIDRGIQKFTTRDVLLIFGVGILLGLHCNFLDRISVRIDIRERGLNWKPVKISTGTAGRKRYQIKENNEEPSAETTTKEEGEGGNPPEMADVAW